MFRSLAEIFRAGLSLALSAPVRLRIAAACLPLAGLEATAVALDGSLPDQRTSRR